MRRFFVVIGILAVIGIGTFLWVQVKHSVAPNQVRVSLGNAKIIADVADTESSREQGLSGRENLAEGMGMLFIFQSNGYPAFWMKDMRFAIDMIWLDEHKRVVYIVPYASPESYPASFTPSSIARYVLEVPSGWAARHKVEVGSVASFQDPAAVPATYPVVQQS